MLKLSNDVSQDCIILIAIVFIFHFVLQKETKQNIIDLPRDSIFSPLCTASYKIPLVEIPVKSDAALDFPRAWKEHQALLTLSWTRY